MPPGGDGSLTDGMPVELQALARGMIGGNDAGDAEQIVAFLCRKFSTLIDRVQASEGRHALVQQRHAGLEQRRAEASCQRRAATEKLQATLKAQRSEARHAKGQLQDMHSKCGFVRTELQRAQETSKSLVDQCESLSVRCRSEHQSAMDAAGAAAQSNEQWEVCERERLQLRGEHATLRSHLAACEEELAAGREKERHRKAGLRGLEEKAATIGRARQAAERRVGTQHDEVCSALRQVSLFRERLHVARHTLLRREEELRTEDEQLASLRADSQQRGQEVATASQVLQQLQDSQVALEVGLRENVALREQHRGVSELRQRSRELDARCMEQQTDLQGRLEATTERVEDVEADCSRWRLCLENLRRGHEQAKAKRDQLDKESRGTGDLGASLQEDLQRIFSATEQLRAEHDEAAAGCDEVQRRVRSVEPALEASRRRVRELEESVDDATSELGRAKQSKETLMREITQYRDKMRGLRRRHERLEERSQSCEKRVVRTSGCHGSLAGTAGFAAAAASVASPTAPQMAHSISGATIRTPHMNAQTPDQCASAANLHIAADDTRSNASQSLGYVRHWIELEEARLNVARTPPMPSPVPSPLPNGCFGALPGGLLPRQPLHAGPGGGGAGASTSGGGGGSNSPLRSAAALAALEAGARPSEVIALLNGARAAGEEEAALREIATTTA